MLRRIAFSLATTAWLAAVSAAAQVGPSQCTAQKYKAAGAYSQALATCKAKAVAKGSPVDAECESRAIAKLDKAFAKAERKDDCLVTGDRPFAASEPEDAIAHLSNAFDEPSVCCAITGSSQCLWAPDAVTCTKSFVGTPGAAGTACDGATGGCAAAPAAGLCCDGTGFGNGCVAGSGLNAVACNTASGAFSTQRICRANGRCENP